MWSATVSEQPTQTECNYRFQGQWFDQESGLHYNFHRYYDPQTARYLSNDPIGLAGGFNTYGYVHNPLIWIDPLGLARCGALGQAKRDLGIPRNQQPDMVVRPNGTRGQYNSVPMTDRNGRSVLGTNGRPIMTREYQYTRSDGSRVIIQDHSAGHQFGGAGGVGDQGPHLNTRPINDTRNGSVPGTQEHYPF